MLHPLLGAHLWNVSWLHVGVAFVTQQNHECGRLNISSELFLPLHEHSTGPPNTTLTAPWRSRALGQMLFSHQIISSYDEMNVTSATVDDVNASQLD
jgi:hypothetical protein